MHVDYGNYSVARYKTREDVTVTLELGPREDGTYFEIVNFKEEDEDEGSE